MTTLSIRLGALLGLVLLGASAWGQENRREPHLGYLYPAGGQRGTTFQVLAGGQLLRTVNAAYVSGEGVSARVVRYARPFNLDGDQARDLRLRLDVFRAARTEEADGKKVNLKKALREAGAGKTNDGDPVELPDHPFLANLEEMSLRQLAQVRRAFQISRKRQPNAQIAETVVLEIEIDSSADPGDRELRLDSSLGITNPMCFQVGLLPERNEEELNDPLVSDELPPERPVEPPVLLNGQILPGDVDRFPLKALRGQDLVVEFQARRLVPYLADAVPGWFQGTLALYDQEGREVAFVDDFGFHSDPVLCFEVPKPGVYELEVRDAIYRGREDFVYRIAVAERPFITRVFPLGGPPTGRTNLSLSGWNLTVRRAKLEPPPGAGGIRRVRLRQKNRPTNEIRFAVDSLPTGPEVEPNDNRAEAQSVELPQIIDGRIGEPGDVDVFQFEGREGEEVVVEVLARKLHSPLDSLLRLRDSSGALLHWNDDFTRREGHLHTDPSPLTHHADSYLEVQLPTDGAYFVSLVDAQHHGGESHAYRLRISHPRPDFELYVTPASLNLSPGRAGAIRVHALRVDGFDEAIDISLLNAPEGFLLDGGRIPAGKDSAWMTITPPSNEQPERFSLLLEGRSLLGGEELVRTATPAEDMMQAFLFRHLVPAEELLVAITGPARGAPPLRFATDLPLQIPWYGEVEVVIRTAAGSTASRVKLELNDPPPGILLEDVHVVDEGLAFWLTLMEEAPPPGFEDNLIIDVFLEREVGAVGTPSRRTVRDPIGILPAIPIAIVEPPDESGE
jgi:hypothetical protein